MALLFVGDSSVAGVGAASQREAMPHRVVDQLMQCAGSRTVSRAVSWQVIASTGATTTSTLQQMEGLELDQFQVVVLALGVNDVTSAASLSGWRVRYRELRTKLRDRTSAGLIVCCGLPPMGHFPALPQPLRWLLGMRADQFSSALEHDLRYEPDCQFLALDFIEEGTSMASDGFHPGPEIYSAWGRRLAELVDDWLARQARGS